MTTKTRRFIYAFLILLAVSFRLFIAIRIPNDEPDDGRVYSQIARNILEQHVYSIESQAPYTPTLIRLPGYPLFLAVAMALTATFAFKAALRKRAITWWIVTGLLAGIAVFFRPDSGLFAAAIGLTLMLPAFSAFRKFREATLYAAIFSLAFCVVLVP